MSSYEKTGEERKGKRMLKRGKRKLEIEIDKMR